jgi:A/G-specific adenine glycosylase
VGFGTANAPVRAVDETATRWIDRRDPGAWNQAMMDLGREHCRAVPRCDGCPLARWCRSRRTGVPDRARVHPQGAFQGSSRQVRGRIVDALRQRSALTAATLSRETGFAASRVTDALAALTRDGLVERSGGSYRLAGASATA